MKGQIKQTCEFDFLYFADAMKDIINATMPQWAFLIAIAWIMIRGFLVGVIKNWECITTRETRNNGWVYVSCEMIRPVIAGIIIVMVGFILKGYSLTLMP